MKYTKSALGMLNSLYRSVLTKCMLINLGLFALAAPANAANVISSLSDFSYVTAGSTVIGTVDLSSYATTSNLATTNSNVATNTTAIATNTGDITSLKTRMTAAETTLTANTTAISTNTGDITSLKTRMTDAETTLTANTTAIATNTGDITSLKTRMTAAEDGIADNASEISDLKTRVTDTEGDIADIQAIIGNPQTTAASSGLLDGEKIGSSISLIDAIDVVANSAAGLDTDNTFSGSNTFEKRIVAEKGIKLGASASSGYVIKGNGEAVLESVEAEGGFKVDDDNLLTADGLVADQADIKGTLSAADGLFEINENGAIAAAGNKFVVNKDGNITKAGTVSAADGKFLVKDGGEVSAAAGTFQVKEGGLISAAAGTFQVKEDGEVSAAAGTFLVKEGGVVSAANGKFEVNENGSIAAADNKFVVNKDGNITKAGTISAADGTFLVKEGGEVSAAAGTFLVKEGGEVSAADGMFEVKEGGEISAAAGMFEVKEGGEVSAAAGNFLIGEDGEFSAANQKFLVNEDGELSAADGMFVATSEGIGVFSDPDSDEAVFAVDASDGSFAAAGGKFEVNENGSIAAADNKFVVNKDGNITKAGTISAADGTFLVKEGGEVSAAAGTFQVKEGGLISAAAGTFLVKENGNVSAADGLFEIKDGGAVTAAGGDFMIDEDGNTLVESLAFNSDPDVFVNAIDQAEAAIVDGEVNEERLQTMATNATIAKTIGDLTSLTDEPAGVTDTTDVASAILTLSTNVEAATGGEFDDEGKWAATVDNSDDSNGYEYTESENIMDAINQVAANVGTADQLSNLFNGVEVANSVNSNINALNGKVGDVSTLNTELKNLTNGGDTAPETVVEALNNLDATLGRVHGLIESEDATTTVNGDDYAGNLAVGTDSTVEGHLLALDGSIGDRRNMTSANAQINEASKESVVAGLNAAGNAIGDMDFSSSHYYKASGADANLSEAVRKLDNNIYRIDNDVRDLRRDFRRGMASMAAMTALVPNSRSLGDTSLSLGTGAYDGHTAMAVGGFHYLTDNLLLNAGAAWGNSNDMSYRLGVTYSF